MLAFQFVGSIEKFFNLTQVLQFNAAGALGSLPHAAQEMESVSILFYLTL